MLVDGLWVGVDVGVDVSVGSGVGVDVEVGARVGVAVSVGVEVRVCVGVSVSATVEIAVAVTGTLGFNDEQLVHAANSKSITWRTLFMFPRNSARFILCHVYP